MAYSMNDVQEDAVKDKVRQDVDVIVGQGGLYEVCKDSVISEEVVGVFVVVRLMDSKET